MYVCVRVCVCVAVPDPALLFYVFAVRRPAQPRHEVTSRRGAAG